MAQTEKGRHVFGELSEDGRYVIEGIKSCCFNDTTRSRSGERTFYLFS
jgi:hypothetical protein